MKKTIDWGIVGGMGQEAGDDAYNRANQMFEKAGLNGDLKPSGALDNHLKKDRSAYILEQMFINNQELPQHVVNGVEAKLKQRNGTPMESPVDEIVTAVLALEKGGAEIGFMACNTAHKFYDEICEKLKKEGSTFVLLSMIEVTGRWLKSQGIGKTGLLATDGTVYSKGVYHPVFKQCGIDVVVCEDDLQKGNMDAIYDPNYGIKYGVKEFDEVPEGRHPVTLFSNSATHLKDKGVSEIIAACTEVKLILKQKNMPEGTHLRDPVDIILDGLVKMTQDKTINLLFEEMRTLKKDLYVCKQSIEEKKGFEGKKDNSYFREMVTLTETQERLEGQLQEKQKETLGKCYDVVELNPITQKELDLLEQEGEFRAALERGISLPIMIPPKNASQSSSRSSGSYSPTHSSFSSSPSGSDCSHSESESEKIEQKKVKTSELLARVTAEEGLGNGANPREKVKVPVLRFRIREEWRHQAEETFDRLHDKFDKKLTEQEVVRGYKNGLTVSYNDTVKEILKTKGFQEGQWVKKIEQPMVQTVAIHK